MYPGISGTMLFSIIIPVYNVEKYLRDCLDSVLGQTCSDWEVVCVNDGSTDESGAILDEYLTKDPRIRVITQVNGGLSAARNTGLANAKGDYILFLDSDDWLESIALEVLAANLNGEDMLCFSGRRYFEESNTFHPSDQLQERQYTSGMEYYNNNALLRRDFAFVCVVLRAYRRLFLLENGLHFKEGIFHEDNLFTPLACFYARKVRTINECLYDYRVRESSITTTENPQRLKDLMGTANELAAFFIPKTGFDKTVAYRAITHHYQVALTKASQERKKDLRKICDWKRYYIVSRTKTRHRINFIKSKIGL